MDKTKEHSSRNKNIIRYCLYCGKAFHPWKHCKSETCSYKCRNEKRKQDGTGSRKTKCETCGKEFIPWTSQNTISRKQARYCSHKCAGIGITKIKKINKEKPWSARRASGKTNHLDNLWRFAVYEKAGNKCEYCGKTEGLNAHHIFSRSNFSVRWDLDNGVCLCVAHHIFGNQSFHKSPAEMIEWIKNKRGNEWYQRLLEKSHQIMKAEVAKEIYKNELENGRYDKTTLNPGIKKHGK